MGFIELRPGSRGVDQYIDLVLHNTATPEYPILTPYKPRRYPDQRGRDVYSFLVDNAAQVSIVTSSYSHLLAHKKLDKGNIVGVGGVRVPSLGTGILAIRVEPQLNYPGLDFFTLFYGIVHADKERHVDSKPTAGASARHARSPRM